ncbi:MAG: glutathione synthase [Burkholderiales bacterium]|nr:glutathione synthase [Burkholderiales bacterium]
MKILFILDPLDSIKTYKDTSYAMMQEAVARGHRLAAMRQEDLVWQNGQVICFAQDLELTSTEKDWYRVADRQAHSPLDFDCILMRKDPPFDMEYVYSTYLLELAEKLGTPVFNRPAAIRDFNEKLSIAKFAQLTVPTLVTRHESLIRDFVNEHIDVILKPLDGMGGTSIFRSHHDDPNLGVIIETLTLMGRRTIMVQRYIPQISEGDKRVLVIDGEPVPYTLARIPKPREHRGNLAAGGRGVAMPITARELEIAEAIGPEIKANGLLLAGLDVIGGYLTEINVTSPTCMREIHDQTGCNVAGIFIDALERNLGHPARQAAAR